MASACAFRSGAHAFFRRSLAGKFPAREKMNERLLAIRGRERCRAFQQIRRKKFLRSREGKTRQFAHDPHVGVARGGDVVTFRKDGGDADVAAKALFRRLGEVRQRAEAVAVQFGQLPLVQSRRR
jgi:hypothetical protein